MRSFGGAGAGPFTISPTGSGSIHELKFTYAHWPSQEGTVVHRGIRIAGDTMNRNVLRPDGTKADTEVHQKVDGDWSSPTADVWELASDEWAGFMMMTDAQYRYLVTRRDRPALPRRPRDMNDADAATIYHSFDAEGEVTLLAQELCPGYQSLREIRRSRVEKHRSSTWWTPTPSRCEAMRSRFATGWNRRHLRVHCAVQLNWSRTPLRRLPAHRERTEERAKRQIISAVRSQGTSQSQTMG